MEESEEEEEDDDDEEEDDEEEDEEEEEEEEEEEIQEVPASASRSSTRAASSRAASTWGAIKAAVSQPSPLLKGMSSRANDDDDDDDDDDASVAASALAAAAPEEYDDDKEDDEEDEEQLELASMTVPELRNLAEERGVSTTGSKAELLSRLSDDALHEYGKSLAQSMEAPKKAGELLALNERLHEILENEAHKDKAVAKVAGELKTLRASHAEDLADLGFSKEVAAFRRKATGGRDLIHEATEEASKSAAAMEAKVKKTSALEAQVQSDNAALRQELQATIARGDAVASKMHQIAGGLSAASAKVAKLKSETVVSEGWASLYEVALEGIEFETERHDQQRDDIVEKLRNIIADVHDENEGQVAMMERHSRDIVAEAKSNLAATFEQRHNAMAQKYTKLRKLLEQQHEMGDDALAQHQAFLEEHYRSKFEEKYEALGLECETLENEVSLLQEEESALAGQVQELGAEATEFEGELKEKEKANKELQVGVTALHGRIGSLRDGIGEAKLELEEGERKGRKVEVDYEMLTAKNNELSEEIDRFGEMLMQAEQALAAAPKGSSKPPSMSAISERSGSEKGTPASSKGRRSEPASSSSSSSSLSSLSASKRKAETPKAKTPKASPSPKVTKAASGSGKKVKK